MEGFEFFICVFHMTTMRAVENGYVVGKERIVFNMMRTRDRFSEIIFRFRYDESIHRSKGKKIWLNNMSPSQRLFCGISLPSTESRESFD